MARRTQTDLDQANIQGAAQQVNTFVYGPRAERSNSALELAAALKEGVKGLADYQQREATINVEQATENKLYGGTLYTNAEPEGLADYDEVKESMGDMDSATKYFLERTTSQEEITDPHVLAGFKEAQAKGLAKFRGQHAGYLSKLKTETRSRDVLNDFYREVDLSFNQGPLPNKLISPQSAFDRLGQIADNYGISKKDTNGIPLGVAEVMISQGKFTEAKAILEYNRGAAGSLLSNPQTAVEAKKLMATIDTEDSVTTANIIKNLEDTTLANQPLTEIQKGQLDRLLESKDITVEKRNNILTKNDEAVKVSDTSKLLGSAMMNGTFYQPIQGLTKEQADKARDKFVADYTDKLETKVADGSMTMEDYLNRAVAFSEKTNSVNKNLKDRMSLGFSSINPAAVLETGEVNPNTVNAIAQYMTINERNANVATNLITDDKAKKFYDSIIMDVKFGGYTGNLNERVALAVRNYSRDAMNPTKTSNSVQVSDADIMTAIEKASRISKWYLPAGMERGIENTSEWVGVVRRQVQEAARRTGNVNVEDMVEHIAKQISDRNIRIGDYLVPAGTFTVDETGYIPATGVNVNELNKKLTEEYVTRNPDEGYDADDLVIVPVTGAKDTWGVSVKGYGQVLEFIKTDNLPASGSAVEQESEQLLQDEGVKKNAKGEHVSYLDSEGYLTGGHGHLMTEDEKALYPEGTTIPQEVVDNWIATDKVEAEQDVAAIFGEVENQEAKKILTNMAFNLGRGNLDEFGRLKKAIANKDYKLAAKSMRESKWAKQVGPRADRLIERMEALS